jgi:hypothetical protein
LGRYSAGVANIIYAEMKHAFGAPVLQLSYRFMTDDWGIDSNTLETKLRWPLGADNFIEPQLRYYTQSEADFYRASLVDGQPLPEFASADFRQTEQARCGLVNLRLVSNHQHRNGRSPQHSLRVAAHDQSRQPTAAVCSEHDQVRGPVLGLRDDLIRGTRSDLLDHLLFERHASIANHHRGMFENFHT